MIPTVVGVEVERFAPFRIGPVVRAGHAGDPRGTATPFARMAASSDRATSGAKRTTSSMESACTLRPGSFELRPRFLTVLQLFDP